MDTEFGLIILQALAAIAALAIATWAAIQSHQTGKVIEETHQLLGGTKSVLTTTRLWTEVLAWEIHQSTAINPMASDASGKLVVTDPNRLEKLVLEKMEQERST